jgi:hypothetical protein
LLLAAVFDPFPVAGPLNQDAPHGDRRSAEEVPAPVPPPVTAVLGQAQVGLVDQGRRLQRQARPLPRNLGPRQLAQFLIDLRQELRRLAA